MKQYIGPKKIKLISGEKEILVEFEDDTKEVLSKLMYGTIVSETPCDLTALREKRVKPVVEAILTVLRDWGIKLNEMPYLSALLTQSLQYNEEEALKKLWTRWIPTLKTLDDVDLITVDKVLRSIKEESKEIPFPYADESRK